MKWSQLKAQIEDRLAPALQGRVCFYNAVYRHSHDGEGRGWITLDGCEILSAATYSAWKAEFLGSAPQIRQWRLPADSDRHADWATGPAEDRRQAVAGQTTLGLYTKGEFNGLLWGYLQLPLAQALIGPIVLHRALAQLDRRLGRRRFDAVVLKSPVHPLEQACRTLRAAVEGWPLADSEPISRPPAA